LVNIKINTSILRCTISKLSKNS